MLYIRLECVRVDSIGRARRLRFDSHLISAVEERGVLFTLHELAELSPLVLGRVDPRRVVRAGVKQEHRLVVRRLHIREQTCRCQAVERYVDASVQGIPTPGNC